MTEQEWKNNDELRASHHSSRYRRPAISQYASAALTGLLAQGVGERSVDEAWRIAESMVLAEKAHERKLLAEHKGMVKELEGRNDDTSL